MSLLLKQMEPVKYKTLVIVESPTKCRTIEKYLGPAYMCVACCGHLREISDGLAGIGIGDDGDSSICIGNDTFKCEPKYTAITKKMHHIRKIKHAISECNGTVLLGTDADREGEAIAWHVCQLFNLPVATTPRITFREITPIALENAIRNPQFIDMNLVHAQQARQVLDLIIGYTTTPLLWAAASTAASIPGSGPKKRKSSAGAGPILSAGRCQTPALRLVYDREIVADAAANSPKYEYNCKAYFTSYNIAFSLLHPIELENISEFLQLYVDNSKVRHTISADTDNVTRVTQSPPVAFKTSTLQRAASSILRFSPSETMECAQLLYEKGFITYHRTDETRTSEGFREQAATYIARTWGADYTGTVAPDNNVSISAHEAIRPVHVALSADKAAVLHRGDLGANETRLYHLIWSRAVQSCMSEATCDKLVVRACNSDSKHVYVYNSYRPVSVGWRACVTISAVSRRNQNTGSDDADNIDNIDNDDELCETFDSLTNKNRENPFHPEYKSYFDFFMNIRNGSILSHNVIKCTTKLKRGAGCARYTESGMIRRLETLGIGRPSTFATILYKIQKREYIAKREIIRTVGTNFDCVNYSIDANGIVKAVGPKLVSNNADSDADTDAYVFGTERNKLQITNVGRMVVDTLMQKCAPVFAYDYTRRMEEALDAVAAGTREWRDVCRECYETITRCISTTTATAPTTTTTAPVDANTRDIITGTDTGILRVINKYASVRDGKYGAYIFYKPPKLTKPKFISLKGFPHNALKCELSVISEWIEDHQ